MESFFRTKEQQEAYDDFKAQGGLEGDCRLCKKAPLKSFEHWIITDNRFYWDKIATVHHMIIPKRHVSEPELSEEERAELLKIKEEFLHKEYDYIVEATYKKKSIPDHFHLHLIVVKN